MKRFTLVLTVTAGLTFICILTAALITVYGEDSQNSQVVVDTSIDMAKSGFIGIIGLLGGKYLKDDVDDDHSDEKSGLGHSDDEED